MPVKWFSQSGRIASARIGSWLFSVSLTNGSIRHLADRNEEPRRGLRPVSWSRYRMVGIMNMRTVKGRQDAGGRARSAIRRRPSAGMRIQRVEVARPPCHALKGSWPVPICVTPTGLRRGPAPGSPAPRQAVIDDSILSGDELGDGRGRLCDVMENVIPHQLSAHVPRPRLHPTLSIVSK